jgi:hypothetical protein
MGLFDLFSNDSAEKARDMANAGATAGYGQLSDLFGQGRDALTSNFGAAGDLYKSLLTSYAPGASAYGDATGANGAAGYARAKTNFQTDPGYGFQMDQGLQALQRTHAAAGNLSSGNADADSLKFALDWPIRAHGSRMSGACPIPSGVNNSAVSGAAGVHTGLGTRAQSVLSSTRWSCEYHADYTIGQTHNAGAEQ